MPPSEGDRVLHGDGYVVAEARIRSAELAVSLLDQKPVLHSALARDKLEPNHYSSRGELGPIQIEAAPRPQDVIGMGVLVIDVRPPLGPICKRVDHAGEILAGRGQLVGRAVPTRFRLDLDHSDSFELSQAGSEE